MRSIRHRGTSGWLVDHDAQLSIKLMYQVKALLALSPWVRAPKVHDALHYITDWCMFGRDILRNSTGNWYHKSGHCVPHG
jgi:hypothetical protein